MSQPRYRPNVTVACVVAAQGRYLLVEECIAGERRFNQPAGHLEAGESVIEACARELLEETGLQCQPHSLVRIHQWRAPDGIEFLRFTFSLRLDEQPAVQPRDPAILACHWLTREEIARLGPQLRSPLVLASIDDFEKAPGVSLSILDDRLMTN